MLEPFDHGFTQSIGSQAPCCVVRGALCPSTSSHIHQHNVLLNGQHFIETKKRRIDLLYTASYVVVLCGHMIAESVCALIHLLAYCPATECTHYVNHANNAIKGFRMYGYQLYSHTLCLPAAPHAQSTILFVCVSGPVD